MTIQQLNLNNWLSIAAIVISMISLLIILIENLINRRYFKDKELLEQLKNSMELAFNSIAIERGNNPFPTNIPLSWLTSARHIIRYRQLRKSLKTNLYKTLCDEQEEYWRNQFYKLLGHIQNSDFFQCIDPGKMIDEHIEPRSAAIVYSFSIWKDGMPDPIENMSFEEIVLNYNLFSPINRAFRQYIEKKHPKLAEKAKKHS